MTDTLNDRGQKILEAIIEDYIGSGDPVGSRAVSKSGSIGLSPATVRNVMADLEDMGYLASPHTSAGRVPTEKGYRFYIDSILQVGSLSPQERARIEKNYCPKDLKIEGVLREAGKLLSGISSYTGIVMAPRFTSTVFRRIEFIGLSQGRVLVVFVSESGLVQNKVIELEDPLSRRELEQITNYLNRTLEGLSISAVKERIVEEMGREKALYDKMMRRALQLSSQALQDEEGEGEVFIEGASNILDQPEFADLDRMKGLFRAFEQKGRLVKLLDKSQRAEGVKIFIGSESEFSEIEGCSLVTSTYSSNRGAIGTLGVIGPTRMPYSAVIPIVDYTARLVSQVLKIESE